MRHLFFLFIFSGCTFMQSVPDYALVESGGVIVSNSSVLFSNLEFKANKEHEEGKLKLDYPFIIENTGEMGRSQINLSNVTFSVHDHSQPVHCYSGSAKKKSVVLDKGGKAQVMCHLEIKPDSKNKLGTRDSRGFINIPILTKKQSSMRLPVILRIEDFQ